MSIKRLFDASVSLIGIILTGPLMIVIAIITKLESRGPVYYRCTRVGQHGRLFKMLKFRTMVESADKIDCKLCCESDVRVTPFGKLLRRTKLNELPQLFNVLSGDMSLVGPRPEDPKFTTSYPDKWSIVLSVKPGVVGPNQILHRNEEDLFPPGCNPESFYVESILPEKLDRDIAFIQNQSLLADLGLLVRGVHATLFKGRLGSRFASSRELYLELLGDLALSVLAYLLASVILLETVQFQQSLIGNISLVLVVNACLFPLSGLYKRSARFFSLPDLLFVCKLVPVAGALFIVANRLILPSDYHSRAVFSMYPLFLFAAIGGVRVIRRIYLERWEQKGREDKPKRNTLIYGAGRLGADTVRRVQFEPDSKLLGLVDDNPSLKNRSILGFRVLGGGHDLAFLRELYHVDRVVIAFEMMANADAEAARRRCIDSGVPEVIIASPAAGVSRAPALIRNNRRKLRFSDQLGMKQVLLEPGDDLASASAVAIIGGGDALGEHLCREVDRLGAKKIFVVDNCSTRLTSIRDHFCHHPLITAKLITVYQPWGFDAETLEVLRAHNVRWIFCNHLNRPGVSSSLNGSTLVLADLIEMVRSVNIATDLPCKGFTLISPVLADSFSKEEKSVHLLCERYLASVAPKKSDGTRYGVIRIPNVLEDENGIFKRTVRNLALGNLAPIPRSPMRFSSARYTARSILNSLPFHNLGETYVQYSGLTLTLETLIDFDSKKEVQDENERYVERPNVETICVRPTADTHGTSKSVRPPAEHLWTIAKPELPYEINYQQVMASFARHLDIQEEIEIADFLTEFSTKTSSLYRRDYAKSSELMSAQLQGSY
jgi:lipopolysaccharide/colanic/teichoic acid biosynthesis glycosyltransferase